MRCWMPEWPSAGSRIRAKSCGKSGWVVPLKTLLWGLATVAVALGSLRWWIACTDPIKAAHASAFIFTSKNLSQGNWGLFDFRPLFSAELWRRLLGCGHTSSWWTDDTTPVRV